MAKELIVARYNYDGKGFTGKREVKMFDENSKVDATLINYANVGLRLAQQADIRRKLQEKNGHKKVSAGGVAVDLSNVESI